jgi:hypothetical protein
MIVSMIKEAIYRHELKPEFDEAFIIRVLTHLLLEFDQIFDVNGYNQKDKVLTDLRKYVNFIKYGLKA